MSSSPSTPRDPVLTASTTGSSPRVGHVYLDVRQRQLRCLNKAARQLHEEGVPFTPADLTGSPLQTLTGEIVTAAHLPLIIAWREGVVAEAEFAWTREGGTVWRVVWSAAPVRNQENEVVGVLASVTCSAPEPDWRSLAELAHDLRTPLTSLPLLSAVLDQNPSENQELTKALEAMRAAADRAVHIATDLLELCRGPAQQARAVSGDWFALEPFLLDLAREQQLSAQRKGLVLDTQLAEVRGWEIQTDRVRLGRLLANLLVNAVRYTPGGRVELNASWRAESSGRLLAIGVVDTGAGISEAEQESIFQPFERGRAGKEGDSGGSGLGLAVVDRLVEELGLTLDVYSEYGRGSAFHLLFPVHLLRETASDASAR